MLPKSPYQLKRRASDAAAAKLKALRDADVAKVKADLHAHVMAVLTERHKAQLTSDDPRTAWLAREVFCAAKWHDVDRAMRARCELSQITEHLPNGMVRRRYPVPMDLDHISYMILTHSKGNKVELIDDNRRQCISFEVDREDFLEFERCWQVWNEDAPLVFSDNPFYCELLPGIPVWTPRMPYKPPEKTVEEMLDGLAVLTEEEYESLRRPIAKRMKFRLRVLDREVAFRRKFLD